MNKQAWLSQYSSIHRMALSKICALVFLLAITTSACGPSQAELSATATQVVADIFATQTALAPTATQTPTPSPTSTPTPTPTVTPRPSPTLDLAVRERQLSGEAISILDSGDPEGAIELCSEAIKADPAFAMAYALRGLIYLGIPDLEAGIADLDRAFELGIDSDLDKEIDSGMTVKTLYYFRGSANMQLGAYEQAFEDLERFLAVTEPLEYAQLRANVQYELGQWQVEPQQVSGGQPFDFEFYSIKAPQGTGWGSKLLGPQNIQIGRVDKLNDQETVYGERTTIASSSVDFLAADYSKDEFLNFACAYIEEVNLSSGRNQAVETTCDYWEKSPEACVQYWGVFEDYGPSDKPFNPPLMMDSYSLLCRHPDSPEVVILVHYSQRGPEGSLDAEVERQAEDFFDGFLFKQSGE